ncbi:unnamed protein product [Musa acuminata subsp. burmannicoides]
MALEGSFFSSALSAVHKEGKANGGVKDSALFGISITDHMKSDMSLSQRPNVSVGVPRAQAAVTTPAIKQTTKGKKTIRKGSVVVTGASSGLGLATAKALAETSKWNVIMACRDFLKAEKGRQVRRHVRRELRRYAPRPRVVGQRPPVREELSAARWACLQCCGNTNTLAGNVSPNANLGDLRELAGGFNGLSSSAMIDGGEFDGAKAFKDSKVCNTHHQRFREHIALFRLLPSLPKAKVHHQIRLAQV